MRKSWLGIDMWHEKGYTGRGVKICIVDADCDVSLSRNPSKITPIGNSGNSPDWTKEYGYHGMASIDVVQQLAPDAEIHFAHWNIPLETVINYCIDERIDVVSVSLRYSHKPVSHATSQRALDKGILLLTSAGNEGDVPTDLRGYPARKATWMAVGAGLVDGVGIKPKRVDYSSTGKELEVMSMTNMFVQLPTQKWVYSGTSCACPVLASMFCLIKQKERELNKEDIRELLLDHCVDMDVEGHDRRTGWGMFRMPNPESFSRIKEIVLTIDDTMMKIDGDDKEMDTEPIIHKNRTMVPISFIAREFGLNVDWDEDKRQVIIRG